MNIVFGIALVALTIGPVLVHFWPVIAALSGGAAAFLGALIGAVAGLGAILVGALYNAKLNRDENKRLRDEQKRAVAVEAQAAMMAVMVQAVSARRVISFYRDSGKPINIGDLVSFELPQREFLEGAPGQLGVLGADLCFKIAQANMWLTIIRQNFAALRLHGFTMSIDVDDLEVHATSFAALAAACQSAVHALEAVTGKTIDWKPPELDLPGSEAAPK